MKEQCAHGHTIRSQADRSQGWCRECKRIYDRNYRARQKALADAARDVVAIFQAAGARFTDGDRPVSADEVAAQLVRVVSCST